VESPGSTDTGETYYRLLGFQDEFGILMTVDFDGVVSRLLNEFCKIAG
jgi:hypothetical protein